MDKAFNPHQVQERGRISALQLSFLAITLVIATADVFLPSFVAQESQQDSWIAVIIGTISAIPAVFLFVSLGLKYPGKTIIQYSCDILGKPLGKAVGLVYTYFFMSNAWYVTRILGELFMISFNPDAPIAVYNISIVIVAAYAVGKGIEVIARVNELLLPLGLGVLGFIAVINIHNMDLKFLLPVFYNGINPSIRGGILILGALLQTVVLLQFIPFVKDRQKVRRNTLISVLVLGLSLELGALTITIFGPLTGKLFFPALYYVKFASLGEYFQNLDISIIGVWISGIFIKITVFYYASVLALSQLFEFKSCKQMIIPTGIIIICFSIAIAETLMHFTHFLHYIYPFLILIIAVIIPAILYTVSFFRKKPSPI